MIMIINKNNDLINRERGRGLSYIINFFFLYLQIERGKIKYVGWIFATPSHPPFPSDYLLLRLLRNFERVSSKPQQQQHNGSAAILLI
mgnify:CR=1 FL=1